MPDEGFLEQPGPAVCDPDETASKPTQAGRSGRVWTGLPLLLVGVSLLPLVRDPFYSDAEHLPYQDLARSPNPLLDPARTAIADIGPYIENQGTFRPLGRAFRAYATSWTVRIAEFSGLTPHVVWGLLRCLFGMAAAYDAPNNDEPAGDRLILPICVAFSFGMIAAGLTGAPIFFPSSYLVVVLIIGASLRWIARPELWLSAPTLSPRHAARAVVSAAIGAALAAWGEVSAIAVPMVLFWAVVMLWVHRRDALRVLTSLGSICCGILVASFLLVTVVGRMAIGRACAAGGCYRYSEFGITSDTPSTLVTRLWSSVPPVRYLWAISNVRATRIGGRHRRGRAVVVAPDAGDAPQRDPAGVGGGGSGGAVRVGACAERRFSAGDRARRHGSGLAQFGLERRRLGHGDDRDLAARRPEGVAHGQARHAGRHCGHVGAGTGHQCRIRRLECLQHLRSGERRDRQGVRQQRRRSRRQLWPHP